MRIEKKFIKLFAECLEIEEDQITQDTIFRDLGEWDSLALLNTLAMLEDEYGVIIAREKFDQLKTLADIIEYIEKRK